MSCCTSITLINDQEGQGHGTHWAGIGIHMDSIEIRQPDDFHVHLRRGELLRIVLPYTARQFARGLVMPNTIPPILDADDVDEYRQEVQAVSRWDFEPLMTIKITSDTSPEHVWSARQAGVVAGKMYPVGVTTNSIDGVEDVTRLFPTLAAMADAEMVLCLHGEQPGVFCLNREEAFVAEVLPVLTTNFPRLRIVLEHVSTAAAVKCVLGQRTHSDTGMVAASITVHHLLLTLDDIIGDSLGPHNFCKPVPKRPEDRSALLAAATSGDARFFLGTDSAPHLRSAKESAAGSAGVFSAPVALPALAQVFEETGRLSQLERFTSVNGALFYRVPLNRGRLTIERRSWIVPAEYGGIVPFLAGQELDWRVSEATNPT